MTNRPLRSIPAARRWFCLLAAAVVVGCSPNPPAATPAASGTPLPVITVPPPTAGPSLPAPSTEPTAAPSGAPPTTIPVTPIQFEGFEYGDILRVRVDRLAAREAPKRRADLVQAYEIGETESLGDVRLNSGDLVSVHLGPVPIGDTVWYLVFPSGGGLHDADVGWYAGDPESAGAGPAWVAASVGDDEYMRLHRRPTLEEIEGYLPLGVNAAGRGDWESPKQARHDFFLFDWIAVAPFSTQPCTFKVTLVAEDGSDERVAIETSTGGQKTSPLTGSLPQFPWLPAPAGSWDEFMVRVTTTCTWAIRLGPLHHD